MKKLFLSLFFFVTVFAVSAQGPIKTWNDQLDDFITVFNELDPALSQLYSDNGINSFAFTYYDPDSGNVVKEATIFDAAHFDKVDDTLMGNARQLVADGLSEKAKNNARLASILGEFAKRNTQIILLYSTNKDGSKATKQIVVLDPK